MQQTVQKKNTYNIQSLKVYSIFLNIKNVKISDTFTKKMVLSGQFFFRIQEKV